LAKRCGIDGCNIESQLDTDDAIKEAIQRLLEPDESTEGRANSQPDTNKTTQQNSNIYVPKFEDFDYESLVRRN
jgi:hypothetical protein